MSNQPILNPNLPNEMTIHEVANYLRVNTLSVRRAEERGEYKHFKRGENGIRIYKKADIEAFLQSIN